MVRMEFLSLSFPPALFLFFASGDLHNAFGIDWHNCFLCKMMMEGENYNWSFSEKTLLLGCN